MGTRTSHRSRTFRTGLAATAAGILVAVTGLAVAPVGASVEDQDPTAYDGNPSCAIYGHAIELKIDVQPVAGTYDADHDDVEVVGALPEGASVTISNVELVGGRLEFDWSSTHAWSLVLVKQANGGLAYEYDPAVTADQDVQTVSGQNSGGISHVTFCGPSTPTTPPPVVDVCLDLPGDQTDPADCATGDDDVCPDVEGIQTDPADCATGDDDVCPDVDGIQTDPADCATGDDDACPNLDGIQAEGPCGPPADVCPEIPGNQAEGPCEEPVVDACPDVDGIQESADECVAVLIPPVVIENLPPQAEAPEVAPIEIPAKVPAETPATPRRPTQVAGIQVLPATAAAQELPRTGVDTGTLVQLGLGLVLAGAGAMVAARRPQEAMAG